MVFCIVLVLLPDPALAAEEAGGIQPVAVTMTEPQVGKTLPTDAKVTSTADAVITKFQWSRELDNGKPRQGAACSASITIEIQPGSAAVQVTVNGQKASDVYKRASCSDTALLLQCYACRNGKSTFAPCPAAPLTLRQWPGLWKRASPAAPLPLRLPRIKPAPGARSFHMPISRTVSRSSIGKKYAYRRLPLSFRIKPAVPLRSISPANLRAFPLTPV